MDRCNILMYHMVSEPKTSQDRRFAIPPHRFARHIRGLADRDYRFVSLADLLNFVSGTSSLPQNAVSLTFDDGYADNYEKAYPILDRYGVPATIFLVSGLVGKKNEWMNGRGFSERHLMSWEQARELDRHGITLGAHTVNHVRLPNVDHAIARRELKDCKRMIEDQLGKEICHFAYPYGLLNESIRDLVSEAGFRTACSTRPGPNTRSTDLLILKRIEVYGTDSVAQVVRKMHFATNDGSLHVPIRYYWRRLKSRMVGQ